ncbi:MAG: PIN domain-containing protein [Desulfurococcales archaeon]|nr:PIN domain-containing protein [Desulfurococcales archaeon]
MDVIFDTNILFSALLGGRVSRAFARAVISLELHTIDALVEEIKSNMNKLTRYTTLTRGNPRDNNKRDPHRGRNTPQHRRGSGEHKGGGLCVL